MALKKPTKKAAKTPTKNKPTKKQVRYYHLPCGTITPSAKAYIKAWRSMAKGVEQAFGWKLRSFDPSFSFIGTDGEIISMSNKTVELINGLLVEICDWQHVAHYYLGDFVDTHSAKECREEAVNRRFMFKPVSLGDMLRDRSK